tara:strand:- start:1357 stop:1944 length:588 start_codon:yes stop_codon:yes gene_type:complete
MDIEEKLVEATVTAEILEIIYNGGSQPGKARSIAPISVENGKVRARCYSSNAIKIFDIAKIVLLSDSAKGQTKDWESGEHDFEQFQTLHDVFQKHSDRLKYLGWYVQIDESNLSLHRARKNGNPLKGSDVQLYYEEYSSDLVIGIDGEIKEENLRPRIRPYGIRAKNFETKTFGILDKAVPIFLEQAEKIAPGKQ